MTWKVRHEGSPRSIEGLTLAQVIEGLQDGLWEPTDEVMGPDDPNWVAIENHPRLAEAAAEIEPPAPKEPIDETRLDMNPLIDVALVLLIFFIMTTSYAALQKMLQMPGASKLDPNSPLKLTKQQVLEVTIVVEVRQKDGQTVIRVEKEPVEESDLSAALSKFAKETRRTNLFIDTDDNVSWGTVVSIMDAAKEARLQRVYLKQPPPGAPR